MEMLITQEELDKLKSRDPVKLKCQHCGSVFEIPKNRVLVFIKRGSGHYCSLKCSGLAQYRRETRKCSNCEKEISIRPTDLRRSKTGRFFCNSSCAATYNNTHKKHGTRRSKLESWLEVKLIERFTDIDFDFNKKDAINSELDIYIPSLKLAFELNGIFHYEPIYGADKLSKIQNNDQRKFQACIENGIELCIIDTSGMNKFTAKGAKKYLKIIEDIIGIKQESGGRDSNPQALSSATF